MMDIFPLTSFHQGQWASLWRGYLDFYNVELPFDVTTQTFKNVCAGSPVGGFAAFEGDEMLGFVHYLMHPSTWSLKGCCYLEDLYVSAAARGKGAGRALIEAVYTKAEAEEMARVYWITDGDNHTAQKLYDKLATKGDYIQYRKTF